MKKLNKKEADNIILLLLSPDDKNQALAISLLQQHPYVIKQLIRPVEVYLAYHKEEKELAVILQSAIAGYNLKESPIYIFHASQQEIISDKEIMYRFLSYESEYKQFLFSDIIRSNSYSYFAHLLATKMEEPELAIILYKKLIQHFPKNGMHYFDLARSMQVFPPKDREPEKIKSEIIQLYNQSYDLNRNDMTLRTLADYYNNDLKDTKNAAATLVKCIKEYPGNHEVHEEYAKILTKEKKWHKAKEIAERCVELHISNNSYYFEREEINTMLGNIHSEGFSDDNNAEKYYKLALDANEYNWESIEKLTEIYKSRKDYHKAIKYQLLALKQQDLNINVMMELGLLYQLTGENNAALPYYKKVLELVPEHEPAIEALKKLI
jgi:tetratricopeptide (TPR) repeat protein